MQKLSFSQLVPEPLNPYMDTNNVIVQMNWVII